MNKKAKKILLLDDESQLSEILKEFLESNGYEVTTAKDGVEGLKKTMVNDYDVILCDMLMPNLPGDKFYIAVERIKPHLCKRFLFMTGHHGNPKMEVFIRRIGGLVLFKPFELHVLLESVLVIIKKASKATP